MLKTVNDLMTVEPVTVAPDTPLKEILTLMHEEGYRQLPVVDETGRLVGIITDRDLRLVMNSPLILHETWQDTALLETATAESCMSRNPICVRPDTPAYRAADMLCTYKFGALPVLDDGRLVGIISVTDFLDQFIEDNKPKGEWIIQDATEM